MSATYNPVSREKEEGNRLGYYYNEDKKVQIVMIQSYSARVDKLPELNPDVIIVDEVDFGFNGQMFKKLVKKHENAQIVGIIMVSIIAVVILFTIIRLFQKNKKNNEDKENTT